MVKLRLLAGIGCVALSVLGCKSRPLGPYVSPRVTGQVLAADTRQPLAGVRVTRGSAHRASPEALKGGQLLMLKPPVQTDQEGNFALASERVLSLVRGANWNVIPLTFSHSGYRQLQTNCPIAAAIFSTEGEPALALGQILLQPASSSTSGR